MSSSVDSRIVSMKFDNSAFERAAGVTLATLAKLKSALIFGSSSRGLDDLQKSADGFNLNSMSNAVSGVSNRFLALSTIGITALATITSKAINAGISIAKHFTHSITDTILGSGKERALALQQAQFQFKGLGLNINKTMASALAAVKGTAFGLQDAATLAAQFGGAGMKAGKQMTAALRSVSGMAAQTGRSYKEIGQVMGGIAGVGRLTSQDLIQFGVRGLNVAAAMAKQMGKSEQQVRQMVTDGKISFQQFAGMMDKAFGKNATKANQTYTGSLANMKAALARIGADIETPKLEAMQKIFNHLTPVIDSVHEALLPLINDFGKLEGKVANKISKFLGTINVDKLVGPVTKGLQNIFKLVGQIVKPIHEAFKDIFPGSALKTLYSMAAKFKEFTSTLTLGGKSAENLKRTFKGVFAVFDILWQVVKGVFGVFGQLFGAIHKGSGGFLSFTGSVGDFLVKLDQAIKKGGLLTAFFEGLGHILSLPILLLGKFGSLLGSAFSSFDGSGLLDKITKFFANIGAAIKTGINTGDVSATGSLLTAAFSGGVFLAVKKFIKTFKGMTLDGGIIKSIKDTFGALTNNLKAMQQQIQAKTLMLIAGAIGVLAASLLVLSMINPKRLATAIAGMTAAFMELLAAMAILVKISGSAGFVKVPLIAGSMVLLASSLLIFTAAVALMSRLSWGSIAKGLAGIAGALVIMAGAMRLMPKGMLLQAAALMGISVALNAIATAMIAMSRLSWKSIAKGLVGIGGALVVIGGALDLMSGSVVGAAALLAVTPALLALSGAMAVMGKMKWVEIAKGLVALAGALVILAAGLYLMTGAIAGAAALVVAAAGIAILTPALVALGALSWGSILKSLAALAGVFVVLGAAGLLLTPVVLPLMGLGAALILIGAGVALAGAGILALATAFGIFTAAGTAGIAMIESMISLIPMFMANVAKGIITFVATLADGQAQLIDSFTKLLVAMIDSVTQVIPKMRKMMVKLINNGLKAIRQTFPNFVKTGMQMIMNLLNGIDKNINRIANKATDIVVKLLNAIGKNYPRILGAGVKMVGQIVAGIAKGVANVAGRLLKMGWNIAKQLANGIKNGLKSLAGSVGSAAKNMAMGAVNSVTGIVGIHLGHPSKVFCSIGKYSAMGMANGLTQYAGHVAAAASDVGSGAVDSIKQTMAKIPTHISSNVDLQPKIAPVLDLTQFKKDAGQMNGVLDTTPVSANVSYMNAASISQQVADAVAAKDAAAQPVSHTTEVKLEQNNYSPKALSASEIYRNTKSQLAQAKEALKAS